jgi:hypothetical protein
MTTSNKQTSQFMQGRLTFSQEDSPANPTQVQEKGLEKRMNAIYGQRCLEQYERLNRGGLSVRTFVEYNRLYFQLQVSTLPTEEIESGLLPTPMAQSRETDKEKTLKRKEKYGGMKRGMYLENYLAMGMLPTPMASDVEGGVVRDVQKDERGQYFRVNKKGERWSVKLRDIAENNLIPTPCARDYKATNSMNHLLGKNGNARTHDTQLPNYVKLKTGSSSQLNPLFVEEMMGFPQNWTLSPFLNGEGKASKDMATP